MKIQPVYICVLLILLGVSSCMGDSEETILYQRLGVVQETPQISFFTVDSFQVTAPFFENNSDLKSGDCFRIDFATPMLDESRKNYFYKVEILTVDTIPVWKMSDEPTDTAFASLRENEELLSSIAYKQAKFVKDRFFLTTELRYLLENEEVTFDLSSNWDHEPVFTSDQRRIYELYLRVLKENGTDTLNTRWKYTNAFIMDDFMKKASEIEREAGNDSLVFRMKYIKEVDEEAEKIIWGNTDSFLIKIPRINKLN